MDPSWYVGQHLPVPENPLVMWRASARSTLLPPVLPVTGDLSCDPKLFEEIHSILDSLAGSENERNWRVVDEIAPTGAVGRNIFLDRAAIKLANIERVFNVTGSLAHVNRPRDFERFTYVALCDGPGAWVEWVQWVRPRSRGWGITIHGDPDTEWHLDQNESDPRYFTIFDGPDGTGDLITNSLALVATVMENTTKTNAGTLVGVVPTTVGMDPDQERGVMSQAPIPLTATRSELDSSGVDLALGDGWIGPREEGQVETPFGPIGGKDIYRRGELLNFELIASELAAGILCLREGGNLVCKVMHTAEEPTVQLLYLVSQCFDAFTVFKPISSRPANAERYVVCMGRRPHGPARDLLRKILEQIQARTWKWEGIVGVDERFRAWIKDLNDFHLRYQLKYVNRLREAYAGKVTKENFDTDRLQLYWRLPGVWGKNYHPRLTETRMSRGVKVPVERFVKPCRNPAYSYISMTREEVNSAGLDEVANWVRNRFPERKFSILPQEVQEMFANLRGYKPVILQKPFQLPDLSIPTENLRYGLTPIVILILPSHHSSMNLITEYFMDLERAKVRLLDQNASPLEEFEKNPKKFVQACLKDQARLDARSLRETISIVAEFKASVMAALIEMFGVDSVYDFSAGRGARMIGCMAKGVRYLGVDPDISLQKGYQQILATLSPLTAGYQEGRYRVLPQKAQDVTVTEKFKLVFTSPPHFNLEHYSDDPSQSDVEFSTVNLWLEGFLFPSIKRAVSALEVGGHLCIDLNDPPKKMIGRQEFTVEMISKLTTWPELVYRGVIAYGEGSETEEFKAVRPIWIWQKTSETLDVAGGVPSVVPRT